MEWPAHPPLVGGGGVSIVIEFKTLGNINILGVSKVS